MTDEFKLIGYIDRLSLPTARAESIYIVDEEGFDGCNVAVFIKNDNSLDPVEPDEVYSPHTIVT